MVDFKRVFIDIETAFTKCAVWKPGYNITVGPGNILDGGESFILMGSWKWEHERKVHNNFCKPFLEKYDVHFNGKKKTLERLAFDDKAVVKELVGVLDEADEVVYANGDRFDMKWIRTRAMYHYLPMSPSYKTFDTYKKSHNLHLNSKKLGYVGPYFGGSGKLDTGGLDLWKDIIERNCPKATKKMMKYCDQDVRELEAFYKRISPYVVTNTSVAAKLGREGWACPECGNIHVRMKKNLTTAKAVQWQMECSKKEDHASGMGRYYTISNSAYIKFLKAKGKKK